MKTLVSAEKYYIFPVYHLLSIYVSLSNACFLSHREGNDLITRALGLIQSYNKSCGSFVKWLHGWLQHKDIQSFDSNTDIFPEYVNFNVNNPKISEIFVAILFIFIHICFHLQIHLLPRFILLDKFYQIQHISPISSWNYKCDHSLCTLKNEKRIL